MACFSAVQKALTWPFLDEQQRMIWAAVLEFNAVPAQEPMAASLHALLTNVQRSRAHRATCFGLKELPPWFFERQNFTHRQLGWGL